MPAEIILKCKRVRIQHVGAGLGNIVAAIVQGHGWENRQGVLTAEGAEIHWCDETGAVADQQPHRGYARMGEPARMEVPDPHIRMNQIAAISNVNGKIDAYAAGMTQLILDISSYFAP